MKRWFFFGLLAFTPAPTRAETALPFDDALAQIVARSTGTAIQEANLGVARARTLPTQFAFFPSVSFEARRSWQGTLPDSSSSRDLLATSQLNLFHWGADVAAYRATRSDEETQKRLYDAAILKVEDDGVKALVAVVQVRKEIAINAEMVKIRGKLAEIGRARYREGRLPIQEVNKIEVDLSNDQSNLSDAQAREADAAATLQALLGRSDIASDWPWLSRVGKSRATPIHSGANSAANSGGDSEFMNRPDLLAARQKVEAEAERYIRNQRLLLPSLDGTASYGYYNPLNSGGASGAGWSGALVLSLPFLDHAVTYANARAQYFVWAAADATLTETERQARAEWIAARQRFGIAEAAAAAREETLRTSNKLYGDSLRRFQTGRSTADDLVIDQRRYFDSELFAVQGWGNAHLAYSRLCHARGKRVTECE